MTEKNAQLEAGLASDLNRELDITKKMQKLLYRLTKDAAKSSFSEYLEYLDISWDEYKTIKNILKEKLNVDLYVYQFINRQTPAKILFLRNCWLGVFLRNCRVMHD